MLFTKIFVKSHKVVAVMNIVKSMRGMGKTISARSRKWATILEAQFGDQKSAINIALLQTIQEGTLDYEYKGVKLQKNPFDLALYSLLISRLMPGTIIEIGSKYGGSAEWFADQAVINGLDSQVWSFDIQQQCESSRASVHFAQADIHKLADSKLPGVLASARRPLLISEDGPHTFSGSLAALRFFDEYLSPGDYIVIEDGNLLNLGYFGFGGGPSRAIKQFMSETRNSYSIDRYYCDFYGVNATWNVNGWIRRN